MKPNTRHLNAVTQLGASRMRSSCQYREAALEAMLALTELSVLFLTTAAMSPSWSVSPTRDNLLMTLHSSTTKDKKISVLYLSTSRSRAAWAFLPERGNRIVSSWKLHKNFKNQSSETIVFTQKEMATQTFCKLCSSKNPAIQYPLVEQDVRKYLQLAGLKCK